MPISVNPINLAALAALAQKYAPDYNLKPAVNDMTQGLLGAAQLDQQGKMQQEALANALMKAKYEQEQMNAREQLKSDTQLRTNENTVNATLRGQDITSADKALDRNQEKDLRLQKLGLDEHQLALDAFYKTNDIDIKKQQAFETAIHNEFLRKTKLDEVQREKEATIYGGAMAALQQAGDDPAAVDQVKKMLVTQLADAGMLNGKDFTAIQNSDAKGLYQTTAMHVKLNDLASMTKAQEQANSEVTKNINDMNKFRRKNGMEELSKDDENKLREKALADAVSGKKQALTPAETIRTQVTADVLKQEQQDASIARSMVPKYDLLEKLSPKALSGTMADTELSVRKAIQSFGDMFGVPVNPEDKNVTASQAFNAMAKNLQLDYQTLLKGSTSDRDLATVGLAVPQLNNTPEGRALMANIGKHMAIMKGERADFRQSWSDTHNGDLAGSEEAWNKYVQSRNDFDEKTLKFNNEGIKSSSWKPFLDENYQPPVRKTAITKDGTTVTYEQRGDGWYPVQ